MQGSRTPAAKDTTSEPHGGNAMPGTPVNASMSGLASQGNQGGTVEYFVSHPCFCSGVGFLYPFPLDVGRGLAPAATDW